MVGQGMSRSAKLVKFITQQIGLDCAIAEMCGILAKRKNVWEADANEIDFVECQRA